MKVGLPGALGGGASVDINVAFVLWAFSLQVVRDGCVVGKVLLFPRNPEAIVKGINIYLGGIYSNNL